ncbi:MAG: hypothetical protein IJ060_11095 [Oscillospiraceae bacterium]|nr:hypothetical protein [Oscillospiraceae bacterium]
MKEMKKTLTALLALTMAFSMASCGDDSSSTAESSTAESSVSESSAESSDESSAESSAESSEESSAAAADPGSAAYTMEQHSTEHAPFGIKLDYAIPALAEYKVSSTQANPHYFGVQSMDSYNYRKEDKSTYGIDISVDTGIWGKENVKFSFEGDNKTLGTTDNGYSLSYTTKYDRTIKANGEEVARYDANLAVYGESYRDAVLITQISLTTSELDMTTDELEEMALAIANSVKFTEWDENTMIADDGSFKVYPHKLICAPKATIGGGEAELQLITSQGYPEAFVQFSADDILYEMNTDILTYNSLKWENAAEKTDEYTSVKIAGYEGLAKLESFGCNGDFIVKFSDAHVEEIKISAKSFADGSRSRDGKSFSDVQKEMIDDANKAATISKMAEYVGAFVGAWTLDDSVQEPQ